MLENMSIPIAVLFTVAGLAVAVLAGIALYGEEPKEAREKGIFPKLQEE